MQSASWIALLQRIPPDQHDNLMLITCNGIEIAIQNILRTEEEYVVLRGRMAGTDKGRFLFLPYNQITYLGFQRVVKEVEVRALFGETVPESQPAQPLPEPETAPTAEPAAAEAAAPPAAAAPAEPAPAPASSKPAAPTSLPDKKTILERLRERVHAASSRPPAHP